MTAREQIAGLLWWQVPSANDAEAKTRAAEMLDAFAAEVRAEAAADVHRAELPKFPADETPENVAKVVRAVDVRLAERGPEAPYGVPAETAADFFQPGHMYLYARMQWKFRCDAVTSHPHTGKRVAVGYSGFGPADWQTSDLSEGVWADGDWTDITTAGAVTG